MADYAANEYRVQNQTVHAKDFVYKRNILGLDSQGSSIG